ncbi:hypothetical protein M8998_09065 [Sphingobacterium sp. lm-10]|uniref:hypothetical protein n=1 Tax=Sphingobacterium sp. lm-10 TaxID=2944904 RepID=UPI00202167A7|nr:hypothetical protein [Sphingobacterium sp. lm-10]MCL7988083.1 hypothetical protein [Sphingobacterium sp. lm-10]
MIKHFPVSRIFARMFTFFQQLIHFLRANSRHGTHSPFVYALADQAVYRSSLPDSKELEGLHKIPLRYRQVLWRLLGYWNKKKVYASEEEQSLGDVCFIKAEELSKKIICQHLNDKVLIVVDGIYRSKRTRHAWRCAQQENQVTVSIDLFHFGVLISRSGQVKENFTLRYPFWIK